jgi:hypothetical protein
MPMSPVVTKVGWGYFSLSCCKKYLLLTWGRCYDHDFLRLSAKNWRFPQKSMLLSNFYII